tara:strand:+ start:1853 stop:2290 length:438 start_codon:yes stop_codon:yes gene_type:complete
MLNDIELELVHLFSQAELNTLQPHPVPEDHPDYKIYTYFNSSLNKMKFGRQCLYYSSINTNTGFTIKELTHDLQISEVAVRDIVKTCVKEGWIDEIVGTNHFTMSEYCILTFVKYIKSKMKHQQKAFERMTNLLTTLYTVQNNLK